MRFLYGDVVKISKQCNYYTQGDVEDPKDVNGVIISTDWHECTENPIRVEWDNGEYNIYKPIDLKLVRRG